MKKETSYNKEKGITLIALVVMPVYLHSTTTQELLTMISASVPA